MTVKKEIRYWLQTLTEDIPELYAPDEATKIFHKNQLNAVNEMIKILEEEEKMINDNYARSEVTEMCPHCMNEVTLIWNPEEDGFKAYCPHCGGRLMLCDACQHDPDTGEYLGNCDYCTKTDTCRYNNCD